MKYNPIALNAMIRCQQFDKGFRVQNILLIFFANIMFSDLKIIKYILFSPFEITVLEGKCVTT